MSQAQEVEVKCQSLRIVNVGQDIIWIDEGETLQPGEAKTYADPVGRGMDFMLNISFLTNPNPPAVNRPMVFAGGRAYIEKFYRES